MIGRRGFITGLISLVAAPAIVRAGSLMPVKVMIEPVWRSFAEIDEVYGHGPLMNAMPYLIDWNAATREIIRITGMPQHWLVER